MPRKLIHSGRLYQDVPYRYASVTPDGLVFAAGACPLDDDGLVVAPGDVPSQTRRTLENLQAALEAAGCGPEEVVKTTVMVASSDREDLIAAWSEYERVYGAEGPPSTLVGVTVLGYPEQLVEIEAIAVLPEAREIADRA